MCIEVGHASKWAQPSGSKTKYSRKFRQDRKFKIYEIDTNFYQGV